MLRQLCIGMLSITLGAVAPAGIAQPEERKAQQPEAGPGEFRWAREWASRELEDWPRRSERLRALVQTIDAGASPDQVRKLLGELRAARRGGGGPGPDPMSGPGGGEGVKPGDPNELGPTGFEGGFQSRRGGRGGPGNSADAKREPTEEDYKTAQEFLQATAPQLFSMYQELRQKDPEAAKAKLREAFPRIQHLLDLKRDDPEMFDLKIKDIRHGRDAFDAGRRIAEFDREHPEGSADPQRQELVASLRAALSEQYDLRSRIIDRELKAMEKDLTRRRDELGRRPDAKQSVVDKMTDDMVRRIKNWRPGKGHGSRGDDAPPPPGDEPAGPRGKGNRERSRDD